jgi:hypothetical protein
MPTKYHQYREEIDGYIVAGTMSEHTATSWSIEFEIVQGGEIVAPLWEDRTRTYTSYSDAADAIAREAKERLARFTTPRE